MNEPLENLYFNWLCIKVMPKNAMYENSPRMKLLKILHNTEFVWLLSGDGSRAADGKELRQFFLIQADIPDNPEWRALPCSILEMCIAFSKRAEFMISEPYRDLFWEFLDNLGLLGFDDESEITYENLQDILETFLWRTYEPNGVGGMFPMNDTQSDQRTIEIWYQFSEYVVDHNRIP